MNTRNLHPPPNCDHGYALVMVLFFGGIGLLALASVIGWVTTNGTTIYRSNQHYRTVAAAEAATEKVLTRMTRDFKNSGETTVYGNLSTYAALVPTSAENAVWSNFEFNNAQGSSGQTYVQRTAAETYAPLESQYTGLSGFVSNYRLVSNAREIGGPYNSTAAVQQDVQFASIPIFQFAIFYNTDMELNGASTLHVRGRVHGNANLFTGSSANQYFYEDVTTSGIISNGMRYGWATNGTVYYYDIHESGRPQMTLPIGTNNTAAAVREVLQPPPSGEDMNSAMGHERYYNKAELVIQVTDTNVSVGVKQPYASTLTSIDWLTVTNTFVTTNKSFTDQRENKLILTTEIDVAKFITWASTNATVSSILGAGTPPNLIYVRDSRTESASKLAGVRLVNGQTLPSRGLTVATPNPLYTKGHFNQPTTAHLGTTNTVNTLPASLVSDAYTILSSNFTDTASSGSFSSRTAVNTTVVAAIVTGNVLSTGSPSGSTGYSGGVNNLPRLLEAWTGRTYTLNGSLVCLFNSAKATSPFQNPGVYYNAPTRNINFDSNFLNPLKLPPGAPALRTLSRRKWVVPPPGTTTYSAAY